MKTAPRILRIVSGMVMMTGWYMAAYGWDISYIEVVSGVNYVNSRPAVTADAGGVLHAAYLHNGSGRLHYAKSVNGGASWTITDVGPSGWGADIALNPAGNPVVSHEGLRVSTFNGQNWTTTIIPGAPSGKNTSVAVSANGDIHVAFYKTDTKTVSYVRYDTATSSWTTPVELEAVGDISHQYEILDLALTADSRPAIAYYEGIFGKLRYADWTGAAWNITTLDSSASHNYQGTSPSLAFGPDGRPQISYMGGRDLRYATRNGSDWTIENLDNVSDLAAYTSLALDSSGWARIAYTKGNPGSIYLKKQYGTGWAAPEQVVAIWTDGISLTLTPDRAPHIVYLADNASMDNTVFHTWRSPLTSISPSDCVFNWAEGAYSNLFAPPGAVSQTQAPYYYRYYSQTNAYLGTSSADNHVYYKGPATNDSIVDQGALTTWLATAGCQ